MDDFRTGLPALVAPGSMVRKVLDVYSYGATLTLLKKYNSLGEGGSFSTGELI